MRWTGADYDAVVEQGLFHQRHVELINGDIFETSPVSEPCAQAICLVDYALRPLFAAETTTVIIRSPMRLGESSRPEPDVAIVPGTPRQNVAHPTTALLVVEVSESTLLAYDRQVKGPLYAAAGIADYWIVNLIDGVVEIHRQPMPDSGTVGGHRYGSVAVHKRGESIAPLAAQNASVKVDDLLP